MSCSKLHDAGETPYGGLQSPTTATAAGLDRWARLERFLILGSDSATYHRNAPPLTREAAGIVIECWSDDAARTARTVAAISASGRALKRSPALFALALGVTHEAEAVRKEAFSAVCLVCRTASDLFEWMDASRQLGKGWGRGMKRVVVDWYESRSNDELADQAIRHTARSSFNHKRAIEVSHKGAGDDPVRRALYLWMRGKPVERGALPPLIRAHLEAMEQDSAAGLVPLIAEHRLPWEALPDWASGDPDVWDAMIPHLDLAALIHGLGAMTAAGSLTPVKTQHVTSRLLSEEALRRSRIHPLALLQALAVYRSGESWEPLPEIAEALETAFHAAFANVEPTGKRILLALDLSNSMASPVTGSPLSCREAAAALALVALAREPHSAVVGFTDGSGGGCWRDHTEIAPLPLSAGQRLDDALRLIAETPFGGTDCALPMLHAERAGLEIDAFLIVTDNETWAGRIPPREALRRYRAASGIAAKCVVLAMASNGFSIADPEDGGMLDIAGMDNAVPALIADFIAEGTHIEA